MPFDRGAQVVGQARARNDLIRQPDCLVAWIDYEPGRFATEEDLGAICPGAGANGLGVPFLKLLFEPGDVLLDKLPRGFHGTPARHRHASRTILGQAQDIAPGGVVPNEAQGDGSGAEIENLLARGAGRAGEEAGKEKIKLLKHGPSVGDFVQGDIDQNIAKFRQENIQFMRMFKGIGVDVFITELDVNIGGLPNNWTIDQKEDLKYRLYISFILALFIIYMIHFAYHSVIYYI